jgi:hypothetical protein
MKSNYELRHTTTRLAAHGFHRKICWKSNCHSPEESCICRLCDRPYEKYHVLTCKIRVLSLTQHSKEDKSNSTLHIVCFSSHHHSSSIAAEISSLFRVSLSLGRARGREITSIVFVKLTKFSTKRTQSARNDTLLLFCYCLCLVWSYELRTVE